MSPLPDDHEAPSTPWISCLFAHPRFKLTAPIRSPSEEGVSYHEDFASRAGLQRQQVRPCCPALLELQVPCVMLPWPPAWGGAETGCSAERVESWRCSLRASGGTVTGKERGHPDRYGEQDSQGGSRPIASRGKGKLLFRLQAGRLDQAFSRQGDWPRQQGTRLALPGCPCLEGPSLTQLLLLLCCRMNVCR